MRHILSPMIEILEKKQTAVLVTIIEQSGSSPRSSGARMLVDSKGHSYGSIGGGIVEKNCQTAAAKMYEEEAESKILRFTLNNETAAENGMICGGTVTVLLQKTAPHLLSLITLLQKEYNKRKRPLLLTRLPKEDEEPEMTVITGYEKTTGTGNNTASLPPELLDTLQHKMRKARTPFTVTAEKERYFAEPLVDPGCLYLVGAGHVSLATAQIASFADFAVKVMDDRAEFANRSRFPDVDEVMVVKDFTTCLPQLGEDDYVVIVTRGHAHDQEVAEQALASGAGYIGMIGSRKKRDISFKQLASSGFSAAQIERIHCPIGLAIGADTPKEIAISIVAELVAHRSKLGQVPASSGDT